MKNYILTIFTSISLLHANPSPHRDEMLSYQQLTLSEDHIFYDTKGEFDILSLKPKEHCSAATLLDKIDQVRPSTIYLRMTHELHENEELMEGLKNYFTEYYFFKTGAKDLYSPIFDKFIIIASRYYLEKTVYREDLNLLEFCLTIDKKHVVHYYAVLGEQSEDQWLELIDYIKENALMDGMAFSIVGEVIQGETVSKLEEALSDYSFGFRVEGSDHLFDDFHSRTIGCDGENKMEREF